METSCSGQVIGLFQLKEKLIREVNKPRVGGSIYYRYMGCYQCGVCEYLIFSVKSVITVTVDIAPDCHCNASSSFACFCQ